MRTNLTKENLLQPVSSLAGDLIQNAAPDIVESALSRPITTGAIVIGGAAVLGTIMLYHAFSEAARPQALSDHDLARHRRLLAARKQFFPDQNMPDEWVLAANKPQYHCNFQHTGEEFIGESSRLHKLTSYDSDAQAFFLTCIGDLYISLSKRTTAGDLYCTLKWQAVRCDGVDVMYYNHLAKWVIEDAASLRPEDPNTLKAYRQILEYCTHIRLTVITEQGDYTRTNPYSTLCRIIDFLTHYIKKIEEHQNTLSLNKIIEELDNRLLGLAYHALHATYLLIDENEGRVVRIEKARFRMDKFLFPQENDPKFEATRNTQLGEWLHKTLTCIGLDHSPYKFNNLLSKESFTQHLVQQHPCDRGFVAPKKRWGHQSFVLEADCQANDSTKSNRYLSEIREHLRGIIEFYFLSQKLVRTSKMQECFGKDWMYGHPAGRAALLLSLQSVEDVIEEFERRWIYLWKEGYAKDYQAYVHKNHINVGTSTAANRPLVEIQLTIEPEYKRLITEIRTQVARVRQEAQQYAQTTEMIERERTHYMIEVLEHYNLRHSKNDEVQLISNTLNQLQEMTSINISQQSIFPPSLISCEEEKGNETEYRHLPQDLMNETAPFLSPKPIYDTLQYGLPTLVRGKKGEFTVFEAAILLLERQCNKGLEVDFEIKDTLMNLPAQFHSTFQADIFLRFLKLNQSFVYRYLHNTWWIWPIQSMGYANVSEFMRLYLAVNTIFHLIYDHQVTLKKLENDMIDVLLYDKINRAFQQYKFYTYSMNWTDGNVLIIANESDITLSYGVIKTRILRADIIQLAERSLLSLRKQEQQIHELTQETTALKEELRVRNAIIEVQEHKIAAQGIELKEKNAERDTANAERDTANAERDTAKAERDTAKAERDTAKAERDTTKAELDKKNKDIEDYQNDVAALSNARVQDKQLIKQLVNELQHQKHNQTSQQKPNRYQLFSHAEIGSANSPEEAVDVLNQRYSGTTLCENRLK